MLKSVYMNEIKKLLIVKIRVRYTLNIIIQHK